MSAATDIAPAFRLSDLLDQVAAQFDVTRSEMVGGSRVASIARARFAFVWVARDGLGASVRAIGDKLGGRDHTTALHAVKRAVELRRTDPPFRRITDRLLADVRDDRHG